MGAASGQEGNVALGSKRNLRILSLLCMVVHQFPSAYQLLNVPLRGRFHSCKVSRTIMESPSLGLIGPVRIGRGEYLRGRGEAQQG